MIMKKIFLYIFLLVPSICFSQVEVIGADDLMIENERIRLFGIDSPEHNQLCKDKNQKKYACGIAAQKYLQKIVTKQTTCQKKGIDKYDRILAVCYSGKVNINSQMVKQGWAVAYTRYANDYISEQNFAKKNKLGMWQGEFENPEDFRIKNYNKK